MTEARYRAVINTSAGWVLAKATARGIVSLSLPSARRPVAAASPVPRAARRHLAALRRQLQSYFDGRPVRFTVPLDLSAFPAFTAAVLRRASRIPYGQVRTYAQLARLAGKPRAARAVGQAMKRNPIPIVGPCHRVVAANGLGGYSAGLHWKRLLLHLERIVQCPHP